MIRKEDDDRGHYIGLDREKEEALAEQETPSVGQSLRTVTEYTILNAVGQVEELSLQSESRHREIHYHHTLPRR